MSKLDIYKLKNGMVLLGERLEHVQSVSFHFMIPAGAALLPDGCCGAASVISDWIFRGAGSRSSRELSEALDGLGIHRHTSVSSSHLSVSASLEAGNLSKAIELFADIILRPSLDPKHHELSRQLTISELEGLDDDPRQKVMMLLSEQFYPDPYGRPSEGKLDELKLLRADQSASFIRDSFLPSKMIFSICGNYDFEAVCRQIETLFCDDRIVSEKQISSVHKGKSYSHFQSEGAQVHIGMMTAVPPISSECYYDLMAAVSVLSGSMSSRLFTEVREKRGLCYAVGARYKTMKDFAGISCYAGSAPDKAQETLDVTREQFDQLKNGITGDELQRAQVGLKTSLVMQSESTSARSAGIAGDYYLLGRVRSLDEIRDKVESLSIDSIVRTLQKHSFKDYTIVTIGPKELIV